MDYVEELFSETKRVYESLPEDIDKEPFSDEFRNYFFPLMDPAKEVGGDFYDFFISGTVRRHHHVMSV